MGGKHREGSVTVRKLSNQSKCHSHMCINDDDAAADNYKCLMWNSSELSPQLNLQ